MRRILHALCVTGDNNGAFGGDVVTLSHARANVSEPAEDVKAGAEKIISKNGERYIAMIDASHLDYLLLYVQSDETIYLLAIRHQRQLSFDFEAHWGSASEMPRTISRAKLITAF